LPSKVAGTPSAVVEKVRRLRDMGHLSLMVNTVEQNR
jgi:hypothetical protein